MMRVFLLSIMLLFMSYPSQDMMAQSQQPKRCEAITKKGTRCKNQTVNNTRYCRVHQAKSSSVQQCKAKTKNGSRCSRAAKSSGYCKQHYQMHIQGKL